MYQSQYTLNKCLSQFHFSLFTSAPSSAFNGPTIKALLALYDNYDINCANPEVVTPAETAEDNAFLDAILATSVMKQAQSFLVSKGLASADVAVFKEYLRTIWMGLFNRGGGTKSSSALEHVFMGEISGTTIQGFHSWIKFYFEEKDKFMNYLGYITKIDLGPV